MVRLPLLLLLSAAAVASTDPLLEFFRGAESIYRISTHNANPHRTYNMTYYDDLSTLTKEQFKKRLGFRVPSLLPDTSSYKANENFKAPDSVDWRTEGLVSPVKNQEGCGSCWAFSAVGAFEGQHAKMRGELIQFSEQFLVDCSTEMGNQGCDGGIVDLALLYVKLKGGIETEEAYPYTGIDGTCKFNSSVIGEKAWGFVDLPSGEEFLKNAVAETGPISVAVQVADDDSFRDYKEGVYYNPNCGTEFSDLNHAVLVVGYGTDPEHGDYWLVKNSWKSTWGENGYIRMARNRNNNCGIASLASYPILE